LPHGISNQEAEVRSSASTVVPSERPDQKKDKVSQQRLKGRKFRPFPAARRIGLNAKTANKSQASEVGAVNRPTANELSHVIRGRTSRFQGRSMAPAKSLGMLAAEERFGQRTTTDRVRESKARQSARIRELAAGLEASGFISLDQQPQLWGYRAAPHGPF
jgi:hypothetical protein